MKFKVSAVMYSGGQARIHLVPEADIENRLRVIVECEEDDDVKKLQVGNTFDVAIGSPQMVLIGSGDH